MSDVECKCANFVETKVKMKQSLFVAEFLRIVI
jgi:hypothetical protein